MNKKAAILMAVLLVGTGCSTRIGQALNPFLSENEVVENVVTVTDPSTGVDTVSTNYVTNVVTRVNPNWEKAISGVKVANSTLNPTPTAPFITIGLSALSSVLGIGVAFVNRRRKRAQGLVNTLIAGVELAGDKKTKEQIKSLANQFKQARDLHKQVKEQTNKDV